MNIKTIYDTDDDNINNNNSVVIDINFNYY